MARNLGAISTLVTWLGPVYEWLRSKVGKLIGGIIMSILVNYLTIVLGNKEIAVGVILTFGVMGVLLEWSHEYGGLCDNQCWLCLREAREGSNPSSLHHYMLLVVLRLCRCRWFLL